MKSRNLSFTFLVLCVLTSGGNAASEHDGRKLFSQTHAGLSIDERMDFNIGKSLFERIWVSAPASTLAADGLGPLYNARSCLACHENNGRGAKPLLRLSIPAQNAEQRQLLQTQRLNVIAEPTYGGQLQDIAIQGLQREGSVHVDYAESTITLADGERVTLRKPSYRIADLGYGPLHAQTRISPRLAPPVIGLGLLEAISEQAILQYSDPDDSDGDGISGKANYVWSEEHGRVMLGRFGWKAGSPTINEQAQAAFFNDLGIAVPLHRQGAGDCTAQQEACLKLPHGNSAEFDNLEAPAQLVGKVVFYLRNLAVPLPREQSSAAVQTGKRLFEQSGCHACHLVMGNTPAYTDLLLHDMGEGLADHRPEGEADGQEWRTAPLWGIGLTAQVNGHENYLHDGRARNLLEAILWHGGEAQKAREAVIKMSRQQRRELLQFIETL